MKFFIPTIPDEEAEDFLKKSILPFLALQGFKTLESRRVFSITFQHKGNTITDTVGQLCASNNEPIFVILETENVFLVCTRYRGVLGGEPLLTGRHNIISVEYFDNTEKDTYKYYDWIYKLEHKNHKVEFPLETPESLFKYYTNNKNSRSALLNNYLFCSHPYHLNDSMDCSNKLWDFSKITKIKYEGFCEYYKESVFLKEIIDYDEDKKRDFNFIKTAFWNIVTDCAGIISLSENPLHTLMWSHYSTERGFMIELDRLKLISEFKKWNHKIRNYVFMPIQYVDNLEMIDFFSNNFTSPDIPFLYSINIKKNDWNYENEWRFVCYSESFGVPNSIIYPQADISGKVERKFFYDKNTLKSLTFGKHFFNGSNLKSLVYPNIYVMKGGEDLDFVDFIYKHYNDRLYLSDEVVADKKYLRSRKQIELQKIDSNTFKIIS